MPITDLLERNAKIYANDVALVEVNPEIKELRRVTWREYELTEPNPKAPYEERLHGLSLMRRQTGLRIF